MSNISTSEASQILQTLPLGAPTLELWLNGLYTCLVVATFYALQRKSGIEGRRLWYWTAIVIALYFFATVHSTMTIVFEVRVFTFHGGDPSVIEAFSNQNRVFRGIIATMFVMTVLIADVLFIWRCWVIWERRWIICVIPILSTVAGTVLAILSIIGQVEVAEKRTPGVVPEHFVMVTTPYFILSLVTSLYSTVLISLRVILVQREMYKLGIESQYKRQYSRMVEIIVESAALNSINLIAFVILTERKSGNLDWPQDIQPQIAGIAPTLILLRVALGHARPDSDWSAPRLGSFGAIVFAHSTIYGGSTTVVAETRGENASVSEGSDLEKKMNGLRSLQA